MISGVEEARRAAREQIGAGANLIKVYADWMHPTLTMEEMKVIVEEAHKAGIKVAAHANLPEGIRNAINAGVDSIEHGHKADRQALELMKAKGVYWVPTIGNYYFAVQRQGSPDIQAKMKLRIEQVRQNLATARELGIHIANGFDPASADDHGQNAEEIVAMTKLGVPAIESIRAATTTAAELLGWQDKVGSLEPAHFADIIAVNADPLIDIEELQHVPFVMKGGAVIKNELHVRD